MLALVISTTSFLPTHGTSAGQPCFSPSRSSCAVVACADKLRAKVSAPRKVPHPVLAAVDKHCRRVPAPHLPHRSEACARCGSRARRRRSESSSGSTSPVVRLPSAPHSTCARTAGAALLLQASAEAESSARPTSSFGQ